MQQTQDLLDQLIASTENIRTRYSTIFDRDLNIVPVPFFGRVTSAIVLTVGFCPSAGELRCGRWPRSFSASVVDQRLTSYFENQEVPPHDWFSPWEDALSNLGVSYYNGTAAHIDISPWPVRSIRRGEGREPWLALSRESLPSFASLLKTANAKLLLMAGTVTGDFYMPKFLKTHEELLGFKISGKLGHGSHVSQHSLTFEDRCVPAWFCSISPSAGTSKAVLPARVREDAIWLRSHLLAAPPNSP